MGSGASGDAFYALGRIEVDQAALKASLTRAEGEVKASVQRQQSVFDKAGTAARSAQAFRGEWWSDPSMAFKGAEDAAKKTEEASEATQTWNNILTATGANTRLLGQTMNLLIPGMGGVAAQALRMGRAFGPLAVAVIAGGVALRIFAQRTQEAAKEQFEIQRSMATKDFGRLDSALVAANEEMAKQLNLVERSNKSWTSLGNIVDSYIAGAQVLWADLTGQGAQAAIDTVARLKEAWREAYVAFGGGKEARETEAALLSFNEQQSRYGIAQSKNLAQLNTWYVTLNEVLGENAEITKKSIEADFEEMAAKRGLVKGTEAYAVARKNADAKLALSADKLKDALYKSGVDQKKGRIELAVAEEQHVQKLIELDKKRIQSHNDAFLQMAKTEHETVKLQQNRVATLVSDTKIIEREYETTIKNIDAERRATDELYQSKKAELTLKTQIGGKEGMQAQKDLALLEKEQAGKLEDLRNRGFQAEADRRQKLAAEQERQFEYVKQQTESYFKFRQQMGDNTSQREIDWQMQIAKTAEVGSKDWYDALGKVHALYEKIRSAAESTLNFVIQTGGEELKSKGRKMATLKELEEETKNQRKKDRELIETAQRGGRVDIDKFQKALGRQRGFEAMEQTGLTGGELLRTATTPASGRMADVMMSLSNGGSLISSGAASFSASVTTFGQLVQQFGAVLQAGIKSPFAGGKVDSSALGREIYLEQRRGPVRQESAA